MASVCLRNNDIFIACPRLDVPMFRDFVGLGGWSERLPDESTILSFRQLLEQHKLAPQMLQTVNELLCSKGPMPRAGTVIDATLIAAPSSTKNKTGDATPRRTNRRRATSGTLA
jgi:transposase, IS5 family